MPDYRRFIAYFYEYINGKRQRNAGFVKAEQRDGVWKLNLQLKSRRWPENGVKIYGYDSEGEVYPVSFLAKGYPQKDSLIQRIQLRADWETVSGKPFETLSGMWIPCGEGRCFLSHWREEEAEIQKLKIVAQQPENAVQQTDENTAPGLEVAEENIAAGLETVETPGGTEQTFTNQPEDLSWEKPPKLRQEPQEFLEAMRKVLTVSEKEKTPEYDMRMETETAIMAEEIKEESVQRTEEQKKLLGEGKRTGHLQSQSRNDLIWQKMHSSHLKITPIPGWECVVICPRDVLWLRQQGWSVGRNSFLMQGFSQYHHLLLGKGEEGDFVLGVPGVENQKNRSAAQAFGYGEFRGTTEQAWKREKENQSGKMSQEQFGYWCRNIK